MKKKDATKNSEKKLDRKGSKDLQKEVGELKNQVARALADYDNLRKRVEKEREVIEKIAGLKIIVRLLPVYDMLIKAENHLKDSGLAITINQFEDVLKQEGVEKIQVEQGDRFNPNLHEAVESISNKDETGTVAEVVLDGWKAIEGPVVRYTKVKVYGEKINKN
jgi:molecular chaperone GrpE